MTGSIRVLAGPMFGGKSSRLLWYINRAVIAKKRCQVFKPDLDDRYGDAEDIITHDQGRATATLFNPQNPDEILEKLLPDVEVVGIDEAQWCTPRVVEICEMLADRGIEVIAAGLDLDSTGKPFGPMPALLARAEHVEKLPAICTVCGKPATRSQRLVESKEQIVVGGADEYEARCRPHHNP